jgi:hypothetical protein
MLDGSDRGYERWVTIPNNFEVNPPFVKKYFEGGFYCAHTILMGNFDEWFILLDWIQNHNQYELNFKVKLVEIKFLEEHLNSINKINCSPNDCSVQIVLLLPIKERS